MGRYKVDLCRVNTSEIPVLDNKEMAELFSRMEKGDSAAKERLINGNLKLVLSIVQRFVNRSDNMDDLFQIGCIGLIKAVDHFDLEHGVRFSTYAVPMIMGEIKRYLRDNQMIRVSRGMRENAVKILKEKERLTHLWQREPSMSELAAEMKMSEKEVSECLEALQSVASLFDPVYNNDGDAMELIDQIRDERNDTERISSILSLRQGMHRLSTKEHEVIRKRYYEGQTQTEIASELGISQAQVSRLEKSALTCLRKSL